MIASTRSNVNKQRMEQWQMSISDFNKQEKWKKERNKGARCGVPAYRLCVYFRRYGNPAAR